MSDRDERAEEYLASLPRFAEAGKVAYKPGLDRIAHLLKAMGDPHLQFPSIHVAGTNGKGSTASFIAAIGTAAGMKIGLHTSPHLFHVAERLRINGRQAPDDWLADAVERIRPVADEIGCSYFEFTVALSFAYFEEEQVDFAVVETGMGGRLDATNVITPEVTVITDIALDHTEFLGDSEEAIAREKAGIIKPGVPILTGSRRAAADVIRAVADEKGAPFHLISDETKVANEIIELRGACLTVETPMRTYHDMYVGLAGRHQIRNALNALRAAELSFGEIRSDASGVFHGMRHVRDLSGIRGRLEILRSEPLIIADVAHNPDGIAAAVEHLKAMGRLNGKFEVLFAAMSDKDVPAMARVLAAAGAVVRPVTVDSPRAVPPEELVHILRVSGIDVADPGTVNDGIRAFLSGAAHSDTLLVTGSHLVVAQLENVSL
ncbi:MAG: folylpolyglutamate synthase/dihydrofolate synthase family protein [Rhodothermales bacterium]